MKNKYKWWKRHRPNKYKGVKFIKIYSQSTIIVLGITLAFIPNSIHFIILNFILTFQSFHVIRCGGTGFATYYIPYKYIITYLQQIL